MGSITRREAIKLMAAATTVPSGCDSASERSRRGRGKTPMTNNETRASAEVVLTTQPLGFQWHPRNPFLFCVHHDDRYPKGNERFGPAASLQGRRIGSDFEGIDGWRMYHGDVVPGFPRHPHRGFETITIVRRGLLDHADSLGGAARYGQGDVQWMTAGAGILHSEMFPLLDQAAPNPVELFQIWINLPRRNKMVQPYFRIFWHHTLGNARVQDSEGRATEVSVIAGRLGDAVAPDPPPDSWASQPDSHVAIWTIKMQPGARFELPAAAAGLNRSLYLFSGSGLKVANQPIADYHEVQLRSDAPAALEATNAELEMLLLQGKPIDDPVAHYGPFVMNTQQEIQQAMIDYQRTQFGGWPWSSDDPVHGNKRERFAKHPDGRRETPG